MRRRNASVRTSGETATDSVKRRGDAPRARRNGRVGCGWRYSIRIRVRIAMVTLAWLAAGPAGASPPSGIFTGTFADGATYEIEIPSRWNGTLILFSHGYVAPGFPNPAVVMADPVSRRWLVDRGYAVAGSSYAVAGWAVEDALHDQLDTLDAFAAIRGVPTRTIAMGHSMGSLITTALVEDHPERFSGAIPMCGIVGGAVTEANMLLDQAFVLKNLVFPNAPVQLVDITDPYGNYFAAISALMEAEADPTGRSQARIALAAAMNSEPGLYDPLEPEPSHRDRAARLQNKIEWINYVSFFGFALRADIEGHAGGNPSWNTGVDYARQLVRSRNFVEVLDLYAKAGLDLGDDLATLAAAPRISADAEAVAYMTEFRTPTGDINVPVLTLHTTGDGLVPVSHERGYAAAVLQHGDAGLLRQLYVDRAGHCTFTSAEVVSALLALERRLDSGRWSRILPVELNALAKSLGPDMGFIFGDPSAGPMAPGFLTFVPPPLLRPQNLGD